MYWFLLVMVFIDKIMYNIGSTYTIVISYCSKGWDMGDGKHPFSHNKMSLVELLSIIFGNDLHKLQNYIFSFNIRLFAKDTYHKYKIFTCSWILENIYLSIIFGNDSIRIHGIWWKNNFPTSKLRKLWRW